MFKSRLIPVFRRNNEFTVKDLRRLCRTTGVDIYVQVWINSNNPIEHKVSKTALERSVKGYRGSLSINLTRTNIENTYLLG